MAETRLSSLTARQLSYRADGRQLIADVSLTLRPGELVTLIGPNGAGKSTLLRLLTGYFTPSRGECRLGDKPLTEWPAAQLARQRAVMRQDNELKAQFKVEEVVAMGRSPWGGAPEPALIDQLLTLTGCGDLRGRLYPNLSGGEQQRVRLARALAQLWRPDGPQGWLFLDEPTSALDLYHQQHLLRLLHSLTRQGRLSVCCVVHDLNLAALWSDRVILLHGGKIMAEGTPQDVLTDEVISRYYQADVLVSVHDEAAVPQVLLRR